jgi:hypothetical protein
MRNNIILFCLLSVLPGLGCEDSTSPKVEEHNPIIGSWEWVSTRQYLGGFILTPEIAGYTRTDHYDLDSIRSIFRNDTLISQKGYLVVADSLRDSSGNTADVLLIETAARGGWDAWMIYYPAQDTLMLYYMGLHGDDVTFKRISTKR